MIEWKELEHLDKTPIVVCSLANTKWDRVNISSSKYLDDTNIEFEEETIFPVEFHEDLIKTWCITSVAFVIFKGQTSVGRVRKFSFKFKLF